MIMDPGYRQLKRHEVIIATDEWWDDEYQEWHLTINPGKTVAMVGPAIYRRKIT